jgi:ketosteroid isomerase-like protein
MSQENVEIVRTLYEAWARDEFPGPLELLDAEIEYVNPDGAIEAGIRRGLPAFIAAGESVSEGWAKWAMEPEAFLPVGDQVAVVVHYRAKGRTSGLDIKGRESALLTLRHGKVVRYEWFHSPEAALEAVGLAE